MLSVLSCSLTTRQSATSVLAACLSGMAQTQQPVEHKQINKQLQTSFVRKFCLFCVSEWGKKKRYQISVSILKILYHSGSKALAPMLQLKLTAFSV